MIGSAANSSSQRKQPSSFLDRWEVAASKHGPPQSSPWSSNEKRKRDDDWRTEAPADTDAAPPADAGTGAGAAQGTGPVGSGEHIVQQGECILSIAQDHGHLFETVWNDPQNAQLQSVRKDPNILLEGDRVHVPSIKRKAAPCQSAARHTFRKKGTARFVLRIVEEPQPKDQPPPPAPAVNHGPKGRDLITEDPAPQSQRVDDVPRVGVPFKLVIDAFTFTGATDGEGKIKVNIPPNAKVGALTLEPGTPNEITLPVHLGFLNPISEISGVKQRLTNLSFACDDGSAEMTPALRSALEAFQQKNGLRVTKDIDQPTRDKLKELHGS